MMKAFISKLVLNTGENLELRENDIVVFVGPNNVGKSQSLSDIRDLSSRTEGIHLSGMIVNDIEFTLENKEDIETQAISDGWAKKDRNGGWIIYDNCISSYKLSDIMNEKGMGIISRALIHYSHAGDISSANAASSGAIDGDMYHPIQFLSNSKELRDKASTAFRRAYGKDLIPHRLAGASIPLCIGSERNLNVSSAGKEGNEALDSIKEYCDNLPRVDQQSEGIKSFVSTLLNLVLKHKRIFLFDEPETFLHPPQIFILGQIICQYLEDRQAFIATHSQELIKGLLEVDPQRVKVLRITRQENINKFQILDNAEILTLWRDPLLKHSDILNGLFFTDTVVCESDADCKMYSVILNDIKTEQGKYHQVLFVPANGKHRIVKIVKPLHTMGIHVIGIFDIDLLSDKQDLKRTIEAFGGKWDVVEKEFHILESQLDQNATHIDRSSFRKEVLMLIDSSNNKELTVQEAREIKSMAEYTSKWGKIKKIGKAAIPAGDATNAFNKIVKYLREIGVYIVEEGELENFIKSCGKHGPEWVAEVLEQFPDHKSEVYKGIRDFVGKWNVGDTQETSNAI